MINKSVNKVVVLLGVLGSIQALGLYELLAYGQVQQHFLTGLSLFWSGFIVAVLILTQNTQASPYQLSNNTAYWSSAHSH